MTKIIDGKKISQEIKDELKAKVLSLKAEGKKIPCLAVIQVGNDPASTVYVGNKKKACEYIGIGSKSFELKEETTQDELIKLIDELTTKMSVQFREQFQKINVSFGETFSELFGGGKAELILEDEMNVLECDIEIKVQPPGKNVQNINLLSGGEKGLSAIALLFAILKVTPAPFVIFDEVEAALDDVNVVRYAQYCRRMTKNTQFVLITHRRGTMEEADMLYGVTMQEEGVSKILELKTAEMARKLGLA